VSIILPKLSLTIVALLLFLCILAIWFYCYAIYGAWDLFGQSQTIDGEFHPPVTILKPICGLDADAYENLASFCQQDYPEYQIIFAVQNPNDPNIEIVQKLIQEYSAQDIELIVCNQVIGANPKVNNLANASDCAKHDIWLIADSDIRVSKNYLQEIIQPFQDLQVGVITCPYRSIVQGWVAITEALGTACEFHPGVLVARKLEGIKFACGSTIAIRKSVWSEIGGWKAIADYLADDFQLGYQSAALGYKVVLSNYVVEHVLSSSSLVESLQRQIRWSKGIRVSRPWGYLGTIFTNGTIISLLLVMITQAAVWSLVLMAVVFLTRMTMAWVVGAWGLKDQSAQRFWWLMPCRDLLSFTVWLCGFVGNTIEWRGQKLKLNRNGKLDFNV
jgi:ceramide glucosyltransferase